MYRGGVIVLCGMVIGIGAAQGFLGLTLSLEGGASLVSGFPGAGADSGQLVFGGVFLATDFAQAVALAEPCGGGSLGPRIHGKAVPAPQSAVTADQPLAGLQRGGQIAALSIAGDHASQRQPT